MRWKYWIGSFFSIALIVSACKTEEVLPDGSLAKYLGESQLPQSDRLIACAAGGQEGILDDPARPLSIFFLPISGASDFRYFETESVDIDPDDLSLFTEKKLPLQPVFNGFLQRFEEEPISAEKWVRLTYRTNDSVHICNAIRLKFTEKPTEFAPGLLEIDQNQPLNPLFKWSDGRLQENAIYFQVVSDTLGNLISGTYTFEKEFQYYDLSNVVLNIRPSGPPASLAPQTSYDFTLMGVSLDNWVNLIIQDRFTTGN